MVIQVILARHAPHGDVGRRLTGRGGSGLATDGRAVAERLAGRLADAGLTAIHASPQQRTRETAGAVAAVTDLPVTIVPALDEIDFGAWTGRTFAELDGDPLWTAWNTSRSTACPPRGERMADAAARALAHIQAASVAGDGPILMVTHCDIIRGVVALVLGLSLDNLLRFDIDPGSVTRLAVGDGGLRVISVNERT